MNSEALIVWVDDELQGVSHDFVSLNEDNIMRIAPDFETGLETKHINLIKLLLGMHKTSKKDRSRL